MTFLPTLLYFLPILSGTIADQIGFRRALLLAFVLLALGSFVGGPLGAVIFNEVMARGAIKRSDGLLELIPRQNTLGWVILMAIGLVSALSMWIFNQWLEKQEGSARARQ